MKQTKSNADKLRLLITSKKMHESERTRDILRLLSLGGRGGKSKFIIKSILYYQSTYTNNNIPCLTELKFPVKCFNSVKHAYNLKTENDFVSFISNITPTDLTDKLPTITPVHLLLTFDTNNKEEAELYHLLDEMSMTSRILLIENAVRAYVVDENLLNANYYMALVNQEILQVAEYYRQMQNRDVLSDIWALMDKTDDLCILCKSTSNESIDPEKYEPQNVLSDIDTLLKL